MNNSINKYDYSLRLYLLNYSFFMLNQNTYHKILLKKKIQTGIRWYITDVEQPQRIYNYNQSSRYNSSTRYYSNTIAEDSQYNSNTAKSQNRTLAINEDSHNNNTHVAQINKNIWQKMLDLNIFALKYNEHSDEKHTLLGLVATEYTHLLFKFANDLLPFSFIYCINYDGFEWILREGLSD
eukprot:209567_1